MTDTSTCSKCKLPLGAWRVEDTLTGEWFCKECLEELASEEDAANKAAGE
jgi:uncharacterized Zn finger protein (UPF0148 family)